MICNCRNGMQCLLCADFENVLPIEIVPAPAEGETTDASRAFASWREGFLQEWQSIRLTAERPTAQVVPYEEFKRRRERGS